MTPKTKTGTITERDLRSAIPDLTGTVRLKGLEGSVKVYRDGYGIPRIKAASELDAFFAQGFVTAQDRLWHMEYDRRRGAGRWAEAVGEPAVAQDTLMRRFRLEASAKADYQVMDTHTKAVFDAYAAGVNAFVDSGTAMPAEYGITGLEPEPWRPWDGLIAYKVRHIFMGVFESKLWRARMVREMGPDAAGKLFPGFEPGSLMILPPGAASPGPLDQGIRELSQGAAGLNYLGEMDSGSNSWVLCGAETATGKPILAGDSHRALDTPNSYYQNQVACPEFDVVGLSFPGVPGFPHFGHNGKVCWSVTHTAADYQDLYIERFKDGEPNKYLFQDQWLDAETHNENIKVRGGNDVQVKVTVTRHGPIVGGDPAEGSGLAFKYTATEQASTWPVILWKMLRADGSQQLVDSMRGWVDPCNNLLFADIHGDMGYLCRGRIPIRSRVNGWLPVPGWTGEHEWEGDIPFDELPVSINPPEGYIATANNRPVGDDYPYYIAIDFTPEFRVKRVTAGLKSLDHPTAGDMAQVHAQRVSIPALAYLEVVKKIAPADLASAAARERLLAWNAEMDAGEVAPTIYSAMRDALLKDVLEANLTETMAEEAWHPADRGLGSFSNRLKAQLVAMIGRDDRSLLPGGDSWPTAVARALSTAVMTLEERLGADMDKWKWEKVHQARPKHNLSAAFPELAGLLDPPAIPTSGDGDTPLQGGYSPSAPATVTSLSVARYSYDPSNWENSLWVVPLGSSGHPGSAHYADQSDTWRQVKMIPMGYDWDRIIASYETKQTLEPG
ncbi:MAG: penicillin acylase family protein [Chloroflexi bacterium]|nr:penicillin acylase family protein [Chloroflexota bacterium]MDA1270164.1 penicillin acylase family protein [Chloroflexota bacterium]